MANDIININIDTINKPIKNLKIKYSNFDNATSFLIHLLKLIIIECPFTLKYKRHHKSNDAQFSSLYNIIIY